MLRSFSRRLSTFRPLLESLESRWCPAVMFRGDLTITGGGQTDQVKIIQDDAHDQLRVEHNGRVDVFTSSAIRTIHIDLGGGNDQLQYVLASDATAAKLIDVRLGAGNDQA